MTHKAFNLLFPHVLRIMVLTGSLLAAASAGAFDLRIDGDRFSVRAEQVPLHDILRQVSHHGIIVRIDPQINPTVSAAFENRNLEEGLKSILGPLNHVFFWTLSDNPANRPSEKRLTLSAIHVFSPGRKEHMKALAPDGKAAFTAVSAPETETPVVINKNKVFVPVVLGYADREIETRLLFDTGAGSLVLHSDAARQLGIEDASAARGFGVGGMEIETLTTRLAYVRVGPHQKTDLRVDIIDYQGPPDPDYNGLLGMNFLKGLRYTIDFDKQVIVWLP